MKHGWYWMLIRQPQLANYNHLNTNNFLIRQPWLTNWTIIK